MTTPNRSLLPNGLLDVLYPEADHEAKCIENLIAVFSRFGYQRVKPPLVEFEDSLLAEGPGAKLARQTFRLMDPVSQKMMGVRADTTAQIARIASSRLASEERPLRLSYAADILRVNGTHLRPERQFCQVGCELIGGDDAHNIVETALMALVSLHEVGVSNLSIDLTAPSLLAHLFASEKQDAGVQEVLLEYASKKDRSALEAHESDIAKVMTSLLDCAGEGAQAAAQIKSLSVPDSIQPDIEQLCRCYDSLSKALKIYALDDVMVTIDPLDHRGFGYQTDVSFTLFSSIVRGELGSGGSYFIEAGQEKATGFTLYMDTIRKAVTTRHRPNIVWVDKGQTWETVKKLQDEGWFVQYGGPQVNCTHVYDQKTVRAFTKEG